MIARRPDSIFALFIASLLAGLAPSSGAPICCPDPTVGPVAFEIVEGLPDKKSWEFEPTEPTARFNSSALALAGLAKKYNSAGVIDDRKAPFLVRGTTRMQLAEGKYRLLLRARGAARLMLDGKIIVETGFRVPSDNGHGAVPELKTATEPGLALLPAENQEQLVTIALDGESHEFRLETIVGDQKLRPELGEISVSISGPGQQRASHGEPSFKLLEPQPSISLSERNWSAYKRNNLDQLAQYDTQTRRSLASQHEAYWNRRHEIAQAHVRRQPAPAVPEATEDTGELTPVDRYVLAAIPDAPRFFRPLVDDYAFLRRVSLDTIGTIPSPEEIAAFIDDKSTDRRARAIDRLLADPRWADHWTSYWQDVLAENPGILKPELNNTGAFRWWIYESLFDNKPFDRFVTELVMMEGSVAYGGPAGFGLATQNDAPLAEKAHVLAKAFLAVELKCARCHDAPYHPFKQHDTFSLAALLDRGEQKLPKTSTVPLVAGARQPAITISLRPGDKIEPEWPFERLVAAQLSDDVLHNSDDSRERLAALLTSPDNERFAEVIVNRMWTRYIGWGLASSVDDWFEAERLQPELLTWLASDFVEHGYDLKHLARKILQSRLYQSEVAATAGAQAEHPLRAAAPLGPARRRMTAEQIVDSLFAAVGKPFNSEELTFDPAGRSPARQFGNLGHARRAWQFTSLSNERDRPALSMPAAQSVVDLLVTFGWRESRQNPLTVRDEEPNLLQPLVLANGVVGARIASVSDDSAVTALALQDNSLDELVHKVYLRIASRPPRLDEVRMFVDLLRDGYAERRVVAAALATGDKPGERRSAVAWSNHLSPEASLLKLEMERRARSGDPPTALLTADWRERMEDMVFALVNSPEFVFVP
jgi:hypothetical protein